MTTIQASSLTAFIVNPAIRARAAARLLSGDAFICPTCENIADTNAGCDPCDTARFDKFIEENEVMMANAEASTGCDAYARY
jgi:hypothetical protein